MPFRRQHPQCTGRAPCHTQTCLLRSGSRHSSCRHAPGLSLTACCFPAIPCARQAPICVAARIITHCAVYPLGLVFSTAHILASTSLRAFHSLGLKMKIWTLKLIHTGLVQQQEMKYDLLHLFRDLNSLCFLHKIS